MAAVVGYRAQIILIERHYLIRRAKRFIFTAKEDGLRPEFAYASLATKFHE